MKRINLLYIHLLCVKHKRIEASKKGLRKIDINLYNKDNMGEEIQKHSVLGAVFLVFERGNSILVAKRKNTGYHDNEYSVPAAALNDGEPASGAAIREAYEEVGIKLRLSEIRLAHVMHRANPNGEDHIDFYFMVENFAGEGINRKPARSEDLRWVKWNALPANTIPEVRAALEYIKQGKIYSEYNFIG